METIEHLGPNGEPGGEVNSLTLKIAGQSLISQLCRECPSFADYWAAHQADYGAESDGAFTNACMLAHFVDEELFLRREREEVTRFLLLLETLFIGGNEAKRDLIGIGFIEDLANITSGRKDGHQVVTPLLPPVLLQVWQYIERVWSGRQSLMEVLAAEKRSPVVQAKWADIITF